MQRRCNTGYEDGNYSLVGGHKDADEEIRQSAIREAKEEVGIEINEKDLQFLQVMHRKVNKNEYIDFVFLAKKWEGTPIINEPEECDELIWIEKTDMPDNVILFIKSLLDEYFDDKMNSYVSKGWQ